MTEPTPRKSRWWHKRRDPAAEGSEVEVRELSFVTLIAALIIGVAFIIAYRFVRPAPPDYFVMSTGNEEGAYHHFGERYRELLAAQKIHVELRPSSGSTENLARMVDPDSGVDVALIQGGVASLTTEYRLQSLGAVYYEPLWIFYRSPVELTLLSQLAGKRIAAGVEGGGTRTLVENVLLGSRAIDTPLLPLGGLAAADALIRGDIDVAMFVVAPDAALVQKLLKTKGIRLMDLSHADALARRFTYLSVITLPRGMLDIGNDIPPSTVHMVATTAHLVAREDFHPALISVLLQAATKVHGGTGMFRQAGEFPAIREGDFPPSEDAQRVLKSGPPFLQRYMPFWVANLIERLLVLLVPLIAVLIPVMRLMPAFYDWRVKRKVFRWYRDLKMVEMKIRNSNGADTAELLRQLDDIEDGVSDTRVPLTYWDYVYTLRGHIDLVRARLTGATAAPVTPLTPPPGD